SRAFAWLGAFSVLSWCRVESASSQAPPTLGDLVTATTTPLRLAIETSALSDGRARVVGGAGRVRIIAIGVEIDNAEAEACLAERSVRSPHRLVSPHTNQTARALVSPSENRVTSRKGITVSATPCVRADPGQPLALAKANRAVRLGDSLDRYGILESGIAPQCCRLPFNSMVYWVSFT